MKAKYIKNKIIGQLAKNRLIKFSLGESSKLAKMSAKGYPLIEFDLKVTDNHYLIGQYKSHLKKELIPIFSINRSTLIVEKDSFFVKQNLPKKTKGMLNRRIMLKFFIL